MEHMTKYTAQIAGVAHTLREIFAEMLKAEDRTERGRAKLLALKFADWIDRQTEEQPPKFQPLGFKGERLEEFERLALVEFVEVADAIRTAYMNRRTEPNAYSDAKDAADNLTELVRSWALLF